MSRNRTICLALIAMTCAMVLPHAVADDWPQWRGPKRDGVWRETGVLKELPKGQLPILWRAPIGGGYSGPTVASGLVYVTDRVVEPKQIERVHCLDAKTGESVWTHTYDCVYEGVGYQAGPRASVNIDQGRAYSLGSMGHLFCFDAKTGDIQWQKDLNATYKIRMPIWGIASSPVIEGDLLIVQVGGSEGACVVAFDKVSGEERWRGLDDDASYSAPIVIDQAGKRVLVVWTGNNVVGMDPQTGSVYWQHEFKPTRMVINIATPAIDGDKLFVSSFYDGSLMLKLATDQTAVEQVWRRLGPDEKLTESLHCMIGTPIVDGDYVYGVDSYGELRCLDAATGDRIWEDKTATPPARWSTIHMVGHGKETWLFNERGELLIGRLSPQGFQELSRAKLIEPTEEQLRQRGGVCWSHPAFANQHIFARNDHEIVCSSLAAE